MIIFLEFFLPQFLSIKEVRPFEHSQPVLQPNVIRRFFQPVRSRYDAVIVELGVQIHFEEFYHFHFGRFVRITCLFIRGGFLIFTCFSM